MKKSVLISIFMLLFLTIFTQTSDAYIVNFKEEYYKLYHVHYQQYPDDCIENIYWLEKAAAADYCNPQFCGIHITSEKQWEKYRYLFQMHINLKLIEQHLRLGRVYDKKNIYFYDAPFKDEYLQNLQQTLDCYKTAVYYWQEAKLWCEKANNSSFNFLYITERQYWEDERERISTGELDYEKILNREIKRVEKNIEELKSMDKTY